MALISNQIVSKCPKCGTSAVFTATFVSDIHTIVRADQKFKENHRGCTSSKTETGIELGHLSDGEIDRFLDHYLNRHPRKDWWAWVRRLFNRRATQ